MMTSPKSAQWLTLVRFNGVDRTSFLQGQLTQDVAQLSPTQPYLAAASCDPKGRVLGVLSLIYEPDAILIGIRQELAEHWLAGILRYKMRAKVDAQVVTDLAVMPLLGGIQRRDASIAKWSIGDLQESLTPASDVGQINVAAWREARLRQGLTDIAAHATGSFTPHMLNLDHAGAISFKKGCYTGQEIVARTEHLGKVKRRVRLLEAEHVVTDDIAQEIVSDGRKLGAVVAAAGHTLAAVISDKDLDAAMTLEDGTRLQLLS